MDFTQAVGGIKPAIKPLGARRKRLSTTEAGSPAKRRRSSSVGDETMDFTTAVGGIRALPALQKQVNEDESFDENEELTMELTTVLGSIRSPKAMATPPNAASTPKNQVRFRNASQSPSRSLQASPVAEKQLRSSPMKVPTPPTAASTPKDQARFENASLSSSHSPQASPAVKERLRNTPLKAATTPQKLSDNIRLLSTPRKDTGASPLKRLKALTPKKTATPQRQTPRKTTPRKRMGTPGRPPLIPEDESVKKIHLNEFLEVAGIRFMDLTTTRRRPTTAPTPKKPSGEVAVEEGLDLATSTVAAVCTIPQLDLYQHSCRELKRYIAEGKTLIKSLEAATDEETPLLLQDYMSASTSNRALIDLQMRDAKTHARLRSKEMWYEWRSKLLEGLKDGLKGIARGFENDSSLIATFEKAAADFLPDLVERRETLEVEVKRAEEARIDSEEREELEAVREKLVQIRHDVADKRRLVEEMQAGLDGRDAALEEFDERKTECLAQIKEAERVREICRGTSMMEIAQLQTSIVALENKHGWSIISTAASDVTMAYRKQLQLFFDTASFLPAVTKAANSPISLIYIPEAPLSTEKRFFLQLMRAHLQCLVQRQTSPKELLDYVSTSWDRAQQTSEAIRELTIEHLTDIKIVSDEKLAVVATMLIPNVATKVSVTLELTVGSSNDVRVTARGHVAYGKAFNEAKLGEVVAAKIGGGLQGWAGAMRELKNRLVARGEMNRAKE
ncbi:hypothetical protein LTR50_005755 [Elasticomyces elasticus]|nr:hypothetical protein LTR50_005755 [Elasticomyces elasticus]